MNRLKTKILGINFDNPLLPASGPSVGSLHSLQFFKESLVGGLVTKTISVMGADVKKPCIVAKNGIVFNTELWSELSLDDWVNDILPVIKKDLEKPLIVCAGYTAEDFEVTVPKLAPFADIFEVSTHYGKDALASLVSKITSLTDKPVFIKLSPHVDHYIEFIQIALDHGAKGVVAINSVGPGLVVDLQSKSVLIGMEGGQSWISGPAIKPIALNRVYNIRKHFPELPIIACGGVENADDVLEFILAGADLVQMLSSALLKGRQRYDEIVKNLEVRMDHFGIESVSDLRKSALRASPLGPGGFPHISHESCTKCQICIKICPEIAMSLTDFVHNDAKRCIRCGLCESKCPVQAISGVIR